jgi:hypothetical protein
MAGQSESQSNIGERISEEPVIRAAHYVTVVRAGLQLQYTRGRPTSSSRHIGIYLPGSLDRLAPTTLYLQDGRCQPGGSSQVFIPAEIPASDTVISQIWMIAGVKRRKISFS